MSSNPEIVVKKVHSAKELDAIFDIRHEVFVEEQKVSPELEYDKFEDTSEHFIAYADGVACGTARWRKTPNGYKLERFAVLKTYRGRKIGSALVQAVLEDLPSQDDVYLHAQVAASSLYDRFGFKREGETFEEAGILHYKMVL
jgi:predicted GNAT family N-acyltransferase